jgi:excisionase family DNA binding protein
MTNDKDYTIKELAKAAGVSVQWIHELIDRGEIQAERFGWMYRVSQAEAERFLAKREKKGD